MSVDLWSFGLIVYEMLEGKHPYCGHGKNLLMVIQTKPLDLGGLKVDNAGKELLRGLLEQDPRKRSWELLQRNTWLGIQGRIDETRHRNLAPKLVSQGR